MWATFVAVSVMTALTGILIVVCVGSYLWLKSTNPAALRTPLPDVGGSPAGFDFLPCPSSLATAPPLAGPPRSRPLATNVVAMGRGMNLVEELSNVLHINDYRSAESVAITIDGNRVWVDVDGKNVFRAYNAEIIQVDDRRVRLVVNE